MQSTEKLSTTTTGRGRPRGKSKLPYGFTADALRSFANSDGTFVTAKARDHLLSLGVNRYTANGAVWSASDPTNDPNVRRMKPRSTFFKRAAKKHVSSAGPRVDDDKRIRPYAPRRRPDTIERAIWTAVEKLNKRTFRTAELRELLGTDAWAANTFLHKNATCAVRGVWTITEAGMKRGNKVLGRPAFMLGRWGEKIAPSPTTTTVMVDLMEADRYVSPGLSMSQPSDATIPSTDDGWWEAELVEEDGPGKSEPVKPAKGTGSDPLNFTHTIRVETPATTTIYWLTALNAAITLVGLIVIGSATGIF